MNGFIFLFFLSVVLPLPHTQREKESIHQKSDAFSQVIKKKKVVGRRRAAIPQMFLLSRLHFLCFSPGKHFIKPIMAEIMAEYALN